MATIRAKHEYYYRLMTLQTRHDHCTDKPRASKGRE
ncbi:hypothetical protein E2C01_063813 [Portunus trituberculatus]|uniref:Uncharacterized protein n=1 Tax=Portunus trituberculatus TaxID=210409 RepID=A0A5B7HHE0_PORTR|nr:hypothetical protein [Portunus trituberculatus]